MSLAKAIDHNQTLVIAAFISLLCLAALLGCHLSQLQKKAIISTAVPVAEALVEGSPIPWSQIGLLLGTLLGGGAVIDNRRKDVLIQRLKKENAQKDDLISAPRPAAGPNLPG